MRPKNPICNKMCEYMKFVPPGHYYSPIPSEDDYRFAYREAPRRLDGLDLRAEEQRRVLKRISAYYGRTPEFSRMRGGEQRFFYDNAYFSYPDATIFSCYVQDLGAKRFVDIGGGISTLLMMDLNDSVLKGRPARIDVIEPYPARLRGWLREGDELNIIERKVQDVDLSFFEDLEPGDILFLDTTHVSKLGSEVNHVVFNILPRLRSGVRVHVHDIYYPFEYPSSYFPEGKYWNEIYLWRAFLTGNARYEIELLNSYLELEHRELMLELFPKYFEPGASHLTIQNTGSSLWLRKA